MWDLHRAYRPVVRDTTKFLEVSRNQRRRHQEWRRLFDASPTGKKPPEAEAHTVIPDNVLPFTGGLFFQLLRRAGVQDGALLRLRAAAILVLPLLAWLPLLALTATDGKLLPGSVGTPFLLDLAAHIRLLVALPLFLVAGRVAEARLLPTLQQFLTRSLVPEESMEKFNAAVASAFRLGDSIMADLFIIAVIYGLDTLVVWRTYHAVNAATWQASPSVSGATLTPAGIYHAYVSLPLFQFTLLRWYYRLFIWARFLAQVAGLGLKLVPTNPDRLGGLGFLLLGTQAFGVFAVAHGSLLAGWLATRVVIRGTPLTEFQGEIVALVVFVLCITLAPLLVFTRSLILTKRRGILEYGTLAAQYAREFDVKWVHHATDCPESEPLVGSSDIQSLADMGGSYDLVQSMRNVPLTPQMILGFAAVTLVPVTPLLLTQMPLSEILSKLVNILF